MNISSGHWYPVLSSREIATKPVAKTRFGQRLVFWRNADGRVACLEDRCAHRGAALSLGRVSEGAIECPFHGFRFDIQGRCVRVPPEGEDWRIPDHFRVNSLTVTEAAGYVWTWRGPAVPAEDLPRVPRQPVVEGLRFGETRSIWNAHYTRCIENVLDYSHLPFVHRTNLGAFNRNPVTAVRVDPIDDGFLFFRVGDDPERQFVEFTYPTLWANKVGKKFVLTATFVPIDDTHTEVYVRWYHAVAPIFLPFVNLFGLLSQYVVFKDDLPIVASQTPANVDDAEMDRLVPSDGGLIAFRKLRREHQQEIRARKAPQTTGAA